MIPQEATIGQVMTRDVITVLPDATMQLVEQLFQRHDFHHLPVVDEDGRVVGIISKSDYYKIQHSFTVFGTIDSQYANQAIMRSLAACDVMTKVVATLHANDPLIRAADYFKENYFHAMPVVDEKRKLVGIITTYDLLTYAYTSPPLIAS